MKACPRFCYYGCGLFLPQKNEVQGDANQDAGEHSPSKLGKNNQQGRDTGQSEDYSQNSQAERPVKRDKNSFTWEEMAEDEV